MLAYHVTSRGNLDSILEHGLTPRTGPNAAQLGETEHAVYCFSSMGACEDALMNWLGEQFDEDDALVILTVRVDGLALRLAEVEWEVAIRETVPPERIVEAVDEEGRRISLQRRTASGA